VCISFARFSVFRAIFQVIQCSCPFPRLSVFSPPSRSYKGVFFIFHIYHCFSPYSRSYSVCFSFYTFFSISRHISCPTMLVSHFPSLSVFLQYDRSYRVYFSFFMFFRVPRFIPGHTVFVSFSTFGSFLTIFQVLKWACLIFYVFSVFLAIFHVIECLCLIFHVCQCSRQNPGPTVCIFHI
jgi:hypothetical protein